MKQLRQRLGSARGVVATTIAALFCAACTSGVGPGMSSGAPREEEEDETPFTTASGDSGNANLGSGGAVVAVLELDAPNRSSFVLRGTVPVPKGTYPRADGKVPLAIRNPDGGVVATQLEIVSRYPKESDGADVVEVLGRVDLPAGAQAGERLQYQVVEDLQDAGKMPIRSGVLQLISDPQALVVTAQDHAGHVYALQLFPGLRSRFQAGLADVRRKGSAAVTFVNYGTLQSTAAVGGPNGALPHMFGVHAYATAWAYEDGLSLDLRFNNGASGHDKSDPIDDVLGLQYFKSIELRVPKGWAVVPDVQDPCFGAPTLAGDFAIYPLVKALPGGKLHVMPSQASFHRRLALVDAGNVALAHSMLAQDGLGFARRGTSPDSGDDLFSFWNPKTPGYFPQRHAMPDLSYLGQSALQSKVNFEFENPRLALETGNPGTWPIEAPALGWAHPWGVGYGGMTGGGEIHLYDGLKTLELGSAKSYRSFELTHRMYVERNPIVLYNKDGKPSALENWLIQGASSTYVDMFYFLRLLPNGGDPFGYNQAPQFQVTAVRQADKDPDYEPALLGYDPIDFQHYIRATRSAKVLAWLGNDELAKDDLKMSAEVFRLSYHEYPNNAYGTAIQSGLRAAINAVNANPDVGFNFGRGEAWGIDCALSAYALGTSEERNVWRPWFAKISDTIAKGQSSCNGFVQAVINDKWVNGDFKARSSVEQAITEHALVGLVERVFRGVDSARVAQTEAALKNSLQAMIGPMAWSNEYHAPWFYLGVAPLEAGSAPFCGGVPENASGNGPDSYQNWSSFAYGHELTGDAKFMQKAAEMAGSNALLVALKAQGFNNLENQAALIATCQAQQ